MSNWTDVATVKKYLQDSERNPITIINERKILFGIEFIELDHINVLAGTSVVKISELNAPHTDTNNPITLNGSTEANLQKTFLVWNSVVAANDALLTTVYAENKDYVIDYTNGTIKRVSLGSAIPDGGTVHVFYLYYTRKLENIDYNMSDASGEIKRVTGKAIPDGATCFIDYTVTGVDPTDELITQAIIDAENWMEDRLLPEFSAATSDASLTSAATYFSLVVVNLSLSVKTALSGSSTASAIANRHMELSEKYNSAGVTAFQKFSKTINLNSGGLIQNRNSGPNYKRNIQSPSISPRTRKR